MDSKHFFLFLLDVEGNILDSNKIFKETVGKPNLPSFTGYLSENSIEEFTNSLDDLFASPKRKQQLLLDLKNQNRNSKIWCEFSVVTNLEMDLLGVLGIGVDVQFLKQEIPWDNLSDVLNFSRIVLDKNCCVLDADKTVGKWLGNSQESILGQSIFDDLLTIDEVEYEPNINDLVNNDFPRFLNLTDSNSGYSYSGLLVQYKESNQLFLLPKKKESLSDSKTKPFKDSFLAGISGSIWIVDHDFKLIQQNRSGRLLSKSWTGNSFSEGEIFQFGEASSRFSMVEEKVKLCLSKGDSSEIDIRLKLSENEFGFWSVNIKALNDGAGERIAALIQVTDISTLGNKLMKSQEENQKLKELAIKPSSILRSPLSSMLGLLDLIDPHQLDLENQKYFSYLKPLAKELDEVIRNNAKKMSYFD